MTVPLYKGRASENNCKYYRGLNFLALLVWHFWSVIRGTRTSEPVGEDIDGYRKGRGCVDHILYLGR